MKIKVKTPQKLNRNFYLNDVLQVARNLLGKILVREINGQILSGRIVEVEAYDGSVDEASHSFKGKTKRNEVMFGPKGYLYVYFTYGMYFCCNVVTGKDDSAGRAVLIRAIEPLNGIEQMAEFRFRKRNISNKELLNLSNGPGKVCLAMNITKSENGIDLLGDSVYILNEKIIPDEKIEITKRIGISKSAELPWRFYIKNNPFVSKK